MKIPTLRRLLLVGIATGHAVASSEAKLEEKPFLLAPDQTVILNQSEYAGRSLQYYLIKALVGAKEAEPYRLDGKGDRSASPYFPLFDTDDELPPGKNVLAVGETRFLSDKDKQRLEDNPGSILIKREGNVIVIAGTPFSNSWQGNYSAMSEFLDQVVGVRFYAPGDLWTSWPEKKQLEIGDLDIFRKQVFASSQLSPLANERNIEWFRMTQNGNRTTIRANHNLANIFPPEKYGKTHPDIYEMRNGQRVIPTNEGKFKAWNPSLVAPELPELTMNYIREQMKKNPQRKFFSLGMMDQHFNDETPAAQESVKRTGDYSELYWNYVNAVAKLAAKEFPGLYITGYSYANAGHVPEDIQFSPNVAVQYVSKSYLYLDPKILVDETKDMTNFANHGAKIMIHDWTFGGVSPRSYTRSLARFLQWGAAHGMIGVYFEWSDGENWYLDGPRYWMLMKLISDPYQDVNILLKTYCDDMFGPASEAMFQFYSHLEDKFVYASETVELLDLPKQEFGNYTKEDLAYEKSLLTRAKEQAKGNPEIEQRLEKISRYWQAHEKFALAAGPPMQMRAAFRKSGKDGLNPGLLDFYAKSDGMNLQEALTFYDNERTNPPDAHARSEDLLGMRVSYLAAYTLPLAEQLREIRRQALEKVTQNPAMDTNLVEVLNAEATRLLRENLPSDLSSKQLARMEKLVTKNLSVPILGTAPQMDGDLSDPIWSQAAVLDGFTTINELGVPTEVSIGKILRVGDTLYLGMRCEQKNGPIWTATSKDTKTGTYVWRESNIEAFFGPISGADEGKLPYAQFVVNAVGAFRGFAAAADLREGVEVAVAPFDDGKGFVFEVALPLKTEKYDFSQSRELSFAVVRNVYYKDSYFAAETSAWHPMFITATTVESRGAIFFKKGNSKPK